MYNVGITKDIMTEKDLNTVKAFFLKTAFSCAENLYWGSNFGNSTLVISGKARLFKTAYGSIPILIKIYYKELIVNEN